MKVYIYKAALLCEPCALRVIQNIWDAGKTEFLGGVDSDRFPQGPYLDGGGEADSPQHCDICHVFLENPLTRDGIEYVCESVTRPGNAVEIWKEFYKEVLQNNEL